MAIPKNISVQDFRQAKFDENVNNLYIVSDMEYTVINFNMCILHKECKNISAMK